MQERASRAVRESPLSKANEAFAVDDRVSHFQYGLGRIIEIDARYTTINFDEAGVRKFLKEVVRLERSDVPAPPKPKVSRAKKAPKKA
jgi:hypothetical protein